MLSLRIAWRFLRSAPVQSILIAAGIAVGIATQVFVGSLIQSLQSSLVNETIGSQPHITIQATDDGEPVRYTDKVREVVTRDSRVERGSVAPVRLINGLYTEGSDSAPLNLIGGDLGGIDGIYNIESRITDGSARLGTDDILVGTVFAEKFGLSAGDTIALSLQGGRTTDFTVQGIFDLGSAAANERTAFVNGSVAEAVLGWSSDEYSAIQAQIAEPFASAEVASDWRRSLPGVEIVEWQAQNADLLSALQAQGSSSYMIQTFVLVAVALGIASTLAIAAVQKTRQIGILKAMGLSDAKAGRIFLWQAAMLGVGGSALGVVLAFGLLALFALAPAVFDINPDPLFVFGSFTVGVAVALASSFVPTRRTSKLDPIEVIQNG